MPPAEPDPHSPDVPTTSKRFVPLENNPVVLTSLAHSLGLSPALSFQDIYSISDPDLLSFVPRPAYALLLVFPVSETYERFRRQEDEGREDYEGKGEKEEVVWWRQTIGNSCGLMGLLHACCNGGAREFIQPNTPLSSLLSGSIPLAPVDRAKLLYDSPVLESLHASAAATGDTAAPDADDVVELHYVCFVVKDGRLWELDGRRKGPLDRGVVGGAGEGGQEGGEKEGGGMGETGEDVLSEKALDAGVRKFMEREIEGGEVRFSLVVLAPDGE